ALAFGILFAAASAQATRLASPEVPMRTIYQQAMEPLTTDLVAKLSPDEVNPHRARWVLSREVRMGDLQAVPRPDGKWGITIAGIESAARSFVRGPGPWYRPLEEFPCGEGPLSAFATLDGTRIAADVGARLWDQVLSSEKMKLGVLLGHIGADNRALALEQARAAFELWSKAVSARWRDEVRREGRKEEWKNYELSAAQAGVCAHGKAVYATSLPSWEKMLEPVPSDPADKKLLARAPAKQWNGLFSVRLNITIGDLRLNGQFLIDSDAATSVISPTFLSNQGVIPAWLEVPGRQLERVTWSGLWQSEGGLARRVSVDRVELSGFALPLKEFLLYETELFGPPESLATCCDGILGNDFLRSFPIEFVPGVPAEIHVWKSEGYHENSDTPWVEAALSQSGEVVSACTLASETSPKAELHGSHWDTGNEIAVDVHLPWQPVAKKHKGYWELSCDGRELSREVVPSLPLPPRAGDTGALAARVPAFDVGMQFLGRGPFVFDLPHGRLWFSKKLLSSPLPENRSGLEIEYVYRGDDRALKVVGIRKGTRAAALLKEGLKPGMYITQIGIRPAEDMDLWEVESLLAGATKEDTVILQWETHAGPKAQYKIAPLRVRD
ncbi:MAG: hypothetical protein ACXVBW_13785, partial [Bdellovibrionota bacterium]